jgi:hypothetical protein
MALTWSRYATWLEWLSVFWVVWFFVDVAAAVTSFGGPFGPVDAINAVIAPLVFFGCRRQSRQCRRHALAGDREPAGAVDLIRRMGAPPEV